jgi:hypothetical protein
MNPSPPTNFARWVKEYGPSNLARTLGLSRWATLAWANGKAFPKPERFATILTIAAGRLSLEDLTPAKEKK